MRLFLHIGLLLFLCFGILNSSSNAQIFIKEELSFSDQFGLIMQLETGTNGIAAADYDLDGDVDLYFVVRDSAWGGDQRTWNRLFSNDNNVFENQTSVSNLTGISQTRWSEMGFNIGASWGDYNNDGYPDIFIYYTGKDQLFRNNGNGTFTNVSSETGISGSGTQLSSHGLWWDYDKDGDLDLYVTVRKDVALSNRNDRNRMYENIGNGHFTDVSEVSGLDDHRLSYMAVALDVNNDAQLDLYVANDFGENSLFLNNGDKSFYRDSTNSFGLNDAGEGMGIAIGDADRNGLFDLYVTNVTNRQVKGQSNPLFINKGETFENYTFSAGTDYAGWGWGTSFFDFDNDMDEDLFVSNGYFSTEYENHFFENITDSDSLSFTETAALMGLNSSDVSRSHLVYDFNDDGFQDLLVSNFYTQPDLYLNSLSDGDWIKIELEGSVTNRNAFGSKIEVTEGSNKIWRYHHGAHFFGQNILPVHFGLGHTTIVDSIKVQWLNGGTEIFTDIAANRSIRIKEGQGIITSNESEIQSPAGSFNLLGNYPNPFNSSTVIRFQIGQSQFVDLQIFNILGQKVHSERSYFSGSGQYSFRWSAYSLNSGVYFYQLVSSSGISRNGRILFIK